MKHLIYLLSFSSIVFTSCNEKKNTCQEDSGEIFHTYYNIKYSYQHSLSNEIGKELARFDDSLNPFKPTSIISKVNNNEETEFDSLFVEVFTKAQEVSVVSGGLFDITCSPLINAWGFGFKNMDNVGPQQIDSLKEFVGYDKIRIENRKIIKSDPRVQINTSAIAKGFSVDIIARLFDSLGIENYMCEIGGEIRAKGLNPHGECWHIGIDKPIDEKIPDHRELQTIVQLCDKAIATSGNYRNFYIKDGKKQAHTIDPKTGYPSAGNILSASVIANDCMTADAYATTFMLTSIAEMRRIAKEQNLDVFLIYTDEDGSIATTYTEGFEGYFVKK
ncbi:FAD:protein FMN transferase [Viscerimonas tarda]